MKIHGVEVIDFFELIFPKMKTMIYGIFNFLVSRCSCVYNFFYKFSANTKFAPFKSMMRKRIEKILEEKKIDIVISTFPVCSKYVSVYKKVKNTNLKLYTYITDVEVNQEWLTDETDAYFVASDETKWQMMQNGVSSNRIKVVGIPVKREFKKTSFEKGKNEILVMGGGLGLLPAMEETLENLAKHQEIHITLLTGKNQKMFEKYYGKYSNMKVVGYTDKVYEYLEKAELILTKAGGITLFEAIHSKTPMYVLNPFLSQEIGNAKFIEKNEMGKVVWNKTGNVAKDILDLLKSPDELEQMRKNMQRIKSQLEEITVMDLYEKGA